MLPLTKEQEALRIKIRDLVEQHISPIAEQIAEEDKFSPEVFEAFRQAGLFTLVLPKEFNGIDAGVLDLTLVTSEISRVSGASALMYFPTQAVMRIITQTATEDQKARWYPEFAQGRTLAAFCLTEPNFGSDAGSLQARGVRDGDDYILTGTKSYITLGQHADYYLTFIRTGPGARTAGVSAFLIPRDAPGLSFGRIEHKMGLGGSVTQEMILSECRVPAANRLLEEGQGWRVLTESANPMRLWGAGSMSLGMAQGAFDLAVAHAKSRKASGHKISRFQSVQFMLAEMAMKLESVRALLFLTAARIDAGDLSQTEAEMLVSICKAKASDTAMEITTDAVQIFGREGVCRGNRVERLFRDAKGVQIFDGSNQVQRMIIASHILS